jgi:hypothetical protein
MMLSRTRISSWSADGTQNQTTCSNGCFQSHTLPTLVSLILQYDWQRYDAESNQNQQLVRGQNAEHNNVLQMAASRPTLC